MQFPAFAESIESACQLEVEAAAQALVQLASSLKELSAAENAQVAVLIQRFDWQLSL
jgi:hypothetical protein